MKFIGKEKWPSKYSEPDDLSKEVDILFDLQHPCITKVLDIVEDKIQPMSPMRAASPETKASSFPLDELIVTEGMKYKYCDEIMFCWNYSFASMH